MREYIEGLSPVVKMVLAGSIGAAFMALIAFLPRDPMVWAIIGGGVVVLAVLFLLLLLAMRIRDKMRDKAMPGIFKGGLSQSPDQRKTNEKFMESIDAYRRSGHSLYRHPWIIVVGESGGGKTEMLRRACDYRGDLNKPVPRDVGTQYMNWWFSNQAVMIDTAGRLMLHDENVSDKQAWEKLLQLLMKHRRRCPINGMVLVVPATSLLPAFTSEADADAAAERICHSFEHMQRTLGFRFPCYVMVTKCDLIPGFREFFADMKSEELRNQIMGWSNPAGIDEVFDPTKLEEHLSGVKTALQRRRYRILFDPVDELGGRRLDQVDVAYTFPEEFAKVAKRLRRYMEKIFAPSEWAPKPLFFRGVYFAYSLEKGTPLDDVVAQALGLSKDQLLQAGGPPKERFLFLRDVFSKKIFPERGLVTTATKANMAYRRRRIAIYGTLSAAALLLIGLTWYQSRQLEKGVGNERVYWAAMERLSAEKDKYELVKEGAINKETGGPDLKVSDATLPVLDWYAQTPGIPEKLWKPPMFRAWSVGDTLDENRAAARDAVMKGLVGNALFEQAYRKLSVEDNWSVPGTVDLLTDLVRLEAGAGAPSAERVQAMFEYAAGAGELSPEQKDKLREVSGALAGALARGKADEIASADVRMKSLKSAVEGLAQWHRDRLAHPEKLLGGKAEKLVASARAFETWEAKLYEASAGHEKVATAADYTAFRKRWVEAFDSADPFKPLEENARDTNLEGDVRDAMAKFRTGAMVRIKALVDAMPESRADMKPWRISLEALAKELKDAGEGKVPAGSDLVRLQARLITPDAVTKRSGYQQLWDVYKQAREHVGREWKPTLGMIAGALDTIGKAEAALPGAIENAEKGKQLSAAQSDTLAGALAAAFAGQRYELADALLSGDEPWRVRVAALAKAREEAKEQAFVTPGVVDPAPTPIQGDFEPFSAKLAADAFAGMSNAIKTRSTRLVERDSLEQRHRAAAEAFDAYRTAYKSYWTAQLYPAASVEFASWEKYRSFVDAELQGWYALENYSRRRMKVVEAMKFLGIDAPAEHDVKTALKSIYTATASLPKDSALARQRLLQDPNQFGTYFIQGDAGEQAFWRAVQSKGFQQLANELAQKHADRIAVLAKLRKFPLDWSVKPEDASLSRNDKFDTIAADLAGLVGMGMTTSKEELDADLKMIYAGIICFRADEVAEVQRMQAIAAALASSESGRVTIKVDPRDNSELGRAYVGVGGETKRLDGSAVIDLVLLDSLHTPLSVTLKSEASTEAPAEILATKGDWAVLRLVRDAKSYKVSADGTVEIVLDASKATGKAGSTLTLQMVFKKNPVPPARKPLAQS